MGDPVFRDPRIGMECNSLKQTGRGMSTINFSWFRHASKQVGFGGKMRFRYSSWKEGQGESGIWSGLSNVVDFTTLAAPDEVPPNAITVNVHEIGCSYTIG